MFFFFFFFVGVEFWNPFNLGIYGIHNSEVSNSLTLCIVWIIVMSRWKQMWAVISSAANYHNYDEKTLRNFWFFAVCKLCFSHHFCASFFKKTTGCAEQLGLRKVFGFWCIIDYLQLCSSAGSKVKWYFSLPFGYHGWGIVLAI